MDSLLSSSQKVKIAAWIKKSSYNEVIAILEKVKTSHAGTAKTKDKRYVIKEIVNNIEKISKNESDKSKMLFEAGSKIFNMKPDVAKEIGISILWRGYSDNKKKAKKLLLDCADHPNWEVREYAGTAFANTLLRNNDFYITLRKWAGHPSAYVRRAVVIGTLGFREKGKVRKAFNLLGILMYDSDIYVKKNLGPFVLGSYFGNSFPGETFRQLDKWVKINNENVRWNIAMAFSNSFGNKYSDKAALYLKLLSRDTRSVVQRAVKSTVNHIKKKKQNIGL